MLMLRSDAPAQRTRRPTGPIALFAQAFPTAHPARSTTWLRPVARLALICRGKRLGFSLTEIKEFLSLYDSSGAQVGQMRYLRRMARERIAALRRQLADVQQTLTELTDIDDQITRHLRRQGADDTTNEEGSRS